MEALNHYFDRYALPNVRAFERLWPAFQFWLLIGSLLTIALTMATVVRFGLSTLVMAMITAAALLTSLALAMFIKILTGEERLAYYHTALAVVAVAILLLWAGNQPILPYLDVISLGVGVLVLTGRIGCFMVGCCHGRPSGCGVCYTYEHADAGFAPYYVGVRLFPVQLIESLLVLLVVSVGVIFVLDRSAQGAFLTWYVINYSVGRFFIEFLRGDTSRPYVLGFSEPQWTSFGLIVLLLWIESVGLLPFHVWHFIACLGLSLAMIGIALQRKLRDKTLRHLHDPLEVRELATMIEFATNNAREMLPPFVPPRGTVPQEIYLVSTQLGIQVSASKIKYASAYHYAFSCRDGQLSEKTAKRIASLVLKLRRATGPSQFLSGKNGVFHLLFCSSEQADSSL